MIFTEIINQLDPSLENILSEFKQEMMKLRTSRLSPGLIEDVEAECFGSILPIKQLGAISSPTQRELLIQLWDQSYIPGVIKAIEREGLGLGIKIDGNSIYLSSPSLTEESRQNLIVLLNKKKEETFQDIRHQRDIAWKKIQDGFQQGEIREDDKFKGKDKLDEKIREYREKVEIMTTNKEQEIKG